MSSNTMKQSPALAALLALTMALSPSVVFAQGFEFGEEEAEETPEGEEVDTQDPAGLEFSEEEAEKTTYSDTAEKQVAVVALAGEHMDADRRQKVQEEMERVAAGIPAITMLSGSSVLGTLEASGGDACVQEPLCLADVGEQAGVERILIARVAEKPDGLELKVDYFDVDDKLFVRFHNIGGLGGTPGVVKSVEPALNKIFDVREFVEGQEFSGDEDSSVVQSVLAYGAGGLAVASLVGGIVFGLKAKRVEDEVTSSPRNGEVYEYTQVEAREAIRPAKSAATTANVFYGLSVGLAAVSVLFFVIRGGSDVADEGATALNDDDKKIRDLQIAPAVTSDGGLGFGASFRF